MVVVMCVGSLLFVCAFFAFCAVRAGDERYEYTGHDVYGPDHEVIARGVKLRAIEDLADELGWQDPSDFERAFQEWVRNEYDIRAGRN